MEISAEHGIIGLLMFLGLLLITWQRLRCAQRLFKAAGDTLMTELAAALQCSFIGYLISAFFLHGVYPQYLWLQIALAIAMATVAARQVAQATSPVAPKHVARTASMVTL